MVEVWADTTPDAVSLALAVQESIMDMEGRMIDDKSFIVSVSCTNPASLMDPDTGSPRYTMTAILAVHTF